MKKIYLTIILALMILVSCEHKETPTTTNSHVDKGKTIPSESKSESVIDTNDNRELILYHNALEMEKFEDKSKYDSRCFYVVTDLNRNEAIIKSYLEKKGTFKEKPDGQINYRDQRLGEYYANEDQGVYSFILHVWNKDLENPKQIAINCFTFYRDDLIQEGYITYEWDENQKVIKENIFNNANSLLGVNAYGYLPKFPFPIITEYKALDDNWSIHGVLNRNQKLWLYEDNIKLGQTGKIIGYKGDVFNSDMNNDYLSFNYDDKGSLSSIVGKETDTYKKGDPNSQTFDMQFNYNEDQVLESCTYNRPSLIYGTYDSSGYILFDDKGRMVYNDFYVTHGGMTYFYFYKNEDRRPWAMLTFDSMACGGWEEDGIEYMYGNNISTYIFEKNISQTYKGGTNE